MIDYALVCGSVMFNHRFALYDSSFYSAIRTFSDRFDLETQPSERDLSV
jgi:hypothetical protein